MNREKQTSERSRNGSHLGHLMRGLKMAPSPNESVCMNYYQSTMELKKKDSWCFVYKPLPILETLSRNVCAHVCLQVYMCREGQL